jgi:hypothetical protein
MRVGMVDARHAFGDTRGPGEAAAHHEPVAVLHEGRLMADEQYRRRWQRKKELYAANGYEERSADNPAGRLVVTEDGKDKGLDSQVIAAIVRELIGG